MTRSGKDNQSETTREEQYGEFVGLLARSDQVIRRFVRSLMPSGDGVDDVMQDTALECWRKISEFQPSGNDAADDFIRWACVVARYKVMSWQRDKSRDRLVFRESVVEQLSQANTDSLPHVEAERQATEVCLQKLTDHQRRLVLSVHSPGESIARIAEESGVKVRRLYSQVNALRTRLLDCIKNQMSEGAIHG